MCTNDERAGTIKLDERFKILPGGMVEISFTSEQCLELGAALLKGAEGAPGEAAEQYHLYSLLFKGVGVAAAGTQRQTQEEIKELRGEAEMILGGRARRLLGDDIKEGEKLDKGL